MPDIRAAILKAAMEAERIHREFESKSRADQGLGRVDVFGMFAKKDIPLMFRPLAGLLGAFLDDPCPGVLVTTQRQLPIQRFTAAHELGHAMLGHKPSFDDEDVLTRMPFSGNVELDLQEREANAFASQLLMPQWLIAIHMRRQQWTARDLARPETTYQLSLRLGTSYAATCHTLSYHKIIGQDVHRDLLDVPPKAIKQELASPYRPSNWFGDVWVISEKDDGLFVEGSRSDLVVLRFMEHSGSGYLWRLDDLAEAGLLVVQDGRTIDDDDSIGGLVSRTVIAKAQNKARGPVHLRETRPWQGDTDAAQSIDLELDLSGPIDHGLLPAQREMMLGVA